MPRKGAIRLAHHAKRSSVDLGSHQMMRMERLDMRHFSMEAGTPAYVAPEIWRCEAYAACLFLHYLGCFFVVFVLCVRHQVL